MKTRQNNQFHRMDVKLPVDIYNAVSTIAVKHFDAKIHHISGKPEITSTLLYLLELGIQSFDGEVMPKKTNTDNNTDTIPISDNEVKDLIKNALIPVQTRLNDIVTIQSKLDELSNIVYRFTNTDNLTDTDNLAVAMTDKILEHLTDTDTDTSTDNIDITPNDSISELPLSETEGENIPNDETTANSVGIQSNNAEKVVNEVKEAVELTSKQKEVMENLKKIPTGKIMGISELAKQLELDRKVLYTFDQWKDKFFIEPKLSKEGKEIGKIYTKL